MTCDSKIEGSMKKKSRKKPMQPAGLMMWDAWKEDVHPWRDPTLGGNKQNLVCTRTRRKEQWPHKRLTQTCLWVSRSLQWRCWSAVAWYMVRGTECGSACVGSFEGGHHYLHYFHHSRPQVNSREGTQLHPSTENLIKDLLSMALPINTRPRFPHSQSLPSGSFHKPLIRGQTEWKPQSQKTSQTDHMDHSLV